MFHAFFGNAPADENSDEPACDATGSHTSQSRYCGTRDNESESRDRKRSAGGTT